MKQKPTPEQIDRARRIAAEHTGTQSEAGADILAGKRDGNYGVQCALTAIIQSDQELQSVLKREADTHSRLTDKLADLRKQADAMAGALVKVAQWCCPVLCVNCKENRETALTAYRQYQEGGDHE